jgi:MSHA biogenesis protein MshI
MLMFSSKSRPGWLAIELRPDRLALVHVVREAGRKPRVALRRDIARAGSDAEDLTRLRRSMALQNYRCTTSVESGSYQIVQANTPVVPSAEVASALRWAIKDALDFPVDDALIHTLPIPVDGAPEGRASTVLAVAARRDRVAARVQAFQRSGLPLRVIDLAETAQRNVAALFEKADRGLACLSFTDKGGLLTFTRNGELYALRHIDVAVAALADGDAPEAVRTAHFERIALELQRSLDNFDRVFSRVVLERLLVAPHAGGDALLAYLRDNLALPVDPLDLQHALAFDEGLEFATPAEQAAWMHPIGLALREEAVGA